MAKPSRAPAIALLWGAASPPSTSTPYGSSTYRSLQPSRRAWRALTSSRFVPLMRSKLSRLSSIAPGSASHLPAGLPRASPLLLRPRCGPRGAGGTALTPNAGPGVGKTAAVPQCWGRAGAAPRVGGGCPFPGFLLEPCALPAALSQCQAHRKVFLAFSFLN